VKEGVIIKSRSTQIFSITFLNTTLSGFVTGIQQMAGVHEALSSAVKIGC